MTLYVLGDSIAEQLASALKSAQRINPHLSGLTITLRRDFTVAASSVEGNLDLLHHAIPSLAASASNRTAVLLSLGQWYNLMPLCAPGSMGVPNGVSYRTACPIRRKVALRALNHASLTRRGQAASPLTRTSTRWPARAQPRSLSSNLYPTSASFSQR